MTHTLPSPVANAIAATVAELVHGGTPGVLLLGSQARGDADQGSDVNLVALGDGPTYSLRRSSQLLLSVSWRTLSRVRASFADPVEAGGAVPGWRSAVVLHDADGELSALIEYAKRWDWQIIEPARRSWIAAEMTSRAENVHRLVRSVTLQRNRSAAINRNTLASRLPLIAAVHQRLLYDSEHRLYDRLCETLGDGWGLDHDMALGLAETSAAYANRAALNLYRRLAPTVDEYLNADQRRVVQAASELAVMV